MNKTKYLAIAFSESVVIILGLVLFFSLKINAQVIPSRIFNNGMVLQRNIEIPVWGTATVAETITVDVNGITASSTVEPSGKWEVKLAAMPAGGPYIMTIKAGTSTKTFTDVYIGDVWLASGQSNMEMTVSSSDDATAEIAAANNPLIRQFKVPKSVSKEPSDELPSGSNWTAATSGNVGSFSAAAYYFAKNLQPEINVPIGIINTSYGGARIEAYMSDEMLGFDEEVVLAGGTYQERQPTLCFNTMINPITKFPIKGFLWYQGESNADNMEDALEYGSLFKTMINGWRELWGLGDIPFLWVQLPNFGEIYTTPQIWDAWPQLRVGQTRALSLPNTGEAITIDVGDVDIHPTNKKPIGKRLALLARKVAYSEDVVFSGPRYKSHLINENGDIVIEFDNVADGLVASDKPDGFAIAGANGSFVWANAQIKNNTVIISGNTISNPAYIRYAWEYNPSTANLYNSEGLPAAPFKISIKAPAFGIKTFSSSATTIERGRFAVMNWEVYGATSLKFNDNNVDSISGIRVVPETTTTYTLSATSKTTPETIDTKLITIEVVDPKPTIAVRTDVGGVADPETEITIIADANPPKGGSIVKVEIMVDGEIIATITEKPYEIKWKTPAEIGKYVITGVVTDNQGYTVTSAPFNVYVTKMKQIIYEAENASFSGTGSIKNNTLASGNKYVDLQSGWVLTFDNVEAPEDGVYPLTIRYLMNYEAPKAQILIVNGKNIGETTFTAPNTTTWMSMMMDVELIKGMNKIEFDDSWGWMSFDYIAKLLLNSTIQSQKLLLIR